MGRITMLRFTLATVFTLIGTTKLAGQICAGLVPFQGQLFHPFIHSTQSNDVDTYGAGVGIGGRGIFGNAILGRLSTSAFWADASTVGGNFGVQLPLPLQHVVQVCPMVEGGLVIGPNDINGTGVRYREQDYGFGATGGIAVLRTSVVSLIPTASYERMKAHSRVTARSGAFNAYERVSDIVTYGLGIVLEQHFSLMASGSWATWAGGNARSINLRVTLVLGGPKTSIVNRHPTPCAAGVASNDSTVYDSTQVSERPRLRVAPELVYPIMQQEIGVAGRVVISVIIGADGAPEVNSATVSRKIDPGLDQRALTWVTGASYWPACRDGQPVRARIAQPVDFCPSGCTWAK